MKSLAVFLCVLFCAASLAAEVPAVQSPHALIQELTGTVEVRLPESPQWVSAREGMRLEQASLISTGLQSSAVILIGQSKIMVRPLTRLSIEELSALRETEQVGLFLRTGKVRAEVTPPDNGRINFTVRSPQATNSVRGTIFEFDTVHVTVEEGRVWFLPASGGGAALVRAGEFSAYIEATALVSLPHALTDSLRPELPPGMENGVAIPEPAVTSPGDVNTGSGPDIDTGVSIGW
jgi:hypothetical protein